MLLWLLRQEAHLGSMYRNIAKENNSTTIKYVETSGGNAILPGVLSDINGQKIEAGKSYTVYILSESNDNNRESSLASSTFTINAKNRQ